MKFKFILYPSLMVTVAISSCGKKGHSAVSSDLTQGQKEAVLTDSKLLLSKLYAHEAVNNNGLDTDGGEVFTKNPDAINNIDASEDTSQFLSDLEDAFAQQHDLHTLFQYPKPQQCYIAGIPMDALNLKIAYDTNDVPYVAVANVASLSQFITSVFNIKTAYDIVKLKHTVITKVNGVNVFDILNSTGQSFSLPNFNRMASISHGANQDARLSRGVDFLFARPGILMKLPAGANSDPSQASNFTITYKKVFNGKVSSEENTVTLPWQLLTKKGCLDANNDEGKSFSGLHTSESSPLMGSFQVKKYLDLEVFSKQNKINSKTNTTPSPVSFLHAQDNKLDLAYLSDIKNPPTKEIISSSKDPSKHYIYLNIPDFEPDVKEYDQSVDEKKHQSHNFAAVKDIIDDLKDYISSNASSVSGIIVDVRDNGGGFVTYGDELAYILTPESIEFDPMYARLLATNENENYLKAGSAVEAFLTKFDEFIRLGVPYTNAFSMETQEFPAQGKLTSASQINFDSSYPRLLRSLPVTVVTNSNCYSSCDLFTARMKDSGAATVVSETQRTGAGGATILDLNGILNEIQSDNKIIDLGENEQLSLLPNGIDMTFAWEEMCSPTKVLGPIHTSSAISPANGNCRILEGNGTSPTASPFHLRLSDFSGSVPYTPAVQTSDYNKDKYADTYIQRVVDSL